MKKSHMEKLHEEALRQNALGVPYIYMDKEDYDGTYQLRDQDKADKAVQRYKAENDETPS
jgi:hypothetical protein